MNTVAPNGSLLKAWLSSALGVAPSLLPWVFAVSFRQPGILVEYVVLLLPAELHFPLQVTSPYFKTDSEF